jgi:hypothetical protein
MDFLVAAWCVTKWGEVGKRVKRLSQSGGKKRQFRVMHICLGRWRDCFEYLV